MWALDTPIKVSYLSIHQNGSTMIVANLSGVPGGTWAANRGTLEGNSATVVQIIHTGTTGGSVTWRYDFTSTTRATLTMVDCVAPVNGICSVPNGASVQIVKIF